ncbi:MAG: hypothetical protein JW841_05275 [Deltaproteobacteria bacterium]|nr:hypothetical protein [Deltaproteobacteria bacterium]
MLRLGLFFIAITIFSLLTISIGAAKALLVKAFISGPGSTIDDQAQKWHQNYKDNGDYNESWFFIVHTNDGGLLIATVYITNLGLNTFDAGYDIAYYDSKGKFAKCHQEYSCKHIRTAKTGFDIQIGRSHIYKQNGNYHLWVDEAELGLDLILTPELPAHQFGNGQIKLPDKKFFALGLNTPRARAAGSLHAQNITANLAGLAQHDHSWGTEKLPTLLKRWQTLRIFSPELTLILYDQKLSDEYNNMRVQTGLFVVHHGNNKKYDLVSLNSFQYLPQKMRREPNSDYEYPTTITISAAGGNYKIQGTIKQSRFLDAVDVLSEISWPVRTAIRIFYAKPYCLRYFGDYQLDIIKENKTTKHISGTAILEANIYN